MARSSLVGCSTEEAERHSYGEVTVVSRYRCNKHYMSLTYEWYCMHGMTHWQNIVIQLFPGQPIQVLHDRLRLKYLPYTEY